ncbi:MAG: efflux RND transporter periplasmic adaptor subunit, partial [Cyanobacteria bacterium J06635_1]
LGDLSDLEVTVQVSELNIEQLSVGQPARVQLDAFPSEGSIPGQIERIAPVADSTSRLVPVQVSIPNIDGRIGSGLLSRVQFSSGQQERVVVPESALKVGDEGSAVFVIEGEGEQAKAIARSVRVGDHNQDRVEILSGLAPGDAFVVQSDRPLTSGQAVRLSVLSEQEAE